MRDIHIERIDRCSLLGLTINAAVTRTRDSLR